tara:strand:+ start:410 stop:637 length:228 start_codon:yes stop_codon:yes gene_type:complete
MSSPYLIFLGPLTALLLFVIMLIMLRDPKANVDNMILLRTLFIKHTGSPPTDEEYVIFGQLTRKEMLKIFKKIKK